MTFGIDTFRNRLDLIGWDLFKAINGGVSSGDHVTGGEPDFAGRNFLGGDFIWAHAEATDAQADPKPEHLDQLNLLTPLIAPMQAPLHDRQTATGDFGYQYGRIDGQAICDRIAASVHSGEFDLPAAGFVNVWLCVDSAVPLSADYWAGWSNQVNEYNMILYWSLMTGVVSGQPFRACVCCGFSAGAGGPLVPGPLVIRALQFSSFLYQWQNTTCYAYWADAASTPPLNWDNFQKGARPLVWRFSHGLRNVTGTVVNNEFDVDATDPRPEAPKPAAFMLKANKWQPNVDSMPNVESIRRYGFIKGPDDPAYTGISVAEINNIGTHPIPQMRDLEPYYTLKGGQVEVIGRYLKTPGHYPSMGRDEAVRLSNADFELFTIWESFNDAAGGEPVGPGSATGVGIRYFDPANHTGTEDARYAFAHCGDVLHQPAQTPVFFCVDFDAAHPNDPSNTLDPAIAAMANPDDRITEIKSRIRHYFELVKAERDAYAQTHPDRYYLIGLYANGGVLDWVYEQGIVNLFWQSGSAGGQNARPRRPWCHANRWQFGDNNSLTAAGWKIGGLEIIDGADPDADWGDGGTWTLNDPLEQQLEQMEQDRLQKLSRLVRWMSGFIL